MTPFTIYRPESNSLFAAQRELNSFACLKLAEHSTNPLVKFLALKSTIRTSLELDSMTVGLVTQIIKEVISEQLLHKAAQVNVKTLSKCFRETVTIHSQNHWTTNKNVTLLRNDVDLSSSSFGDLIEQNGCYWIVVSNGFIAVEI